MITLNVIYTLLGLVVAAYAWFQDLGEKAERYRSVRDRAQSAVIAQVTETLGKALEPPLVELALRRPELPELLELFDRVSLVRKVSDILEQVGVHGRLREYANDYSSLFVEYHEVERMCDRLITSLRRLRDSLLRGGGALLAVGLILAALQALKVVVPPLVQCGPLALILCAAVVVGGWVSSHNCLADHFEDKCSQLTRNGTVPE